MKTQPNFQDADSFYENLLDAHLGLSQEQSEAFNARLILVLANQIGDTALLRSCIEAATWVGSPQFGKPVSTEHPDKPVE